MNRDQFRLIFLFHIFTQFSSSSFLDEVELKIYSEDGGPSILLEQITGKHRDLVIEIPLPTNPLLLDLQLNEDFENEIGKSEGIFRKEVVNCNRITPRYYTGKIRGNDNSAVNLIICEAIKGLIRDGNKIIKVATGLQENKVAVSFNNDPFYDFQGTSSLTDRENCQVPRRVKRDTANDYQPSFDLPIFANASSLYIKLALVVDKNVYEGMNSDKTKVYQLYKKAANMVNALYQKMNIFVVLVDIEIRMSKQVCSDTKSSDACKDKFKEHIEDHYSDQKFDLNCIFLTTNFPNNEPEKHEEKFGTDSMCSNNPIPGGLIFNIKEIDNTTSIALCIAHLLGSILDLTVELKGDHRSIMRTLLEDRGLSWSNSSKAGLYQLVNNKTFPCFDKPPSTLFHKDGSNCGNSFREEGELCDCGDWSEKCPCCNSTNCQPQENFTCASGDCCDLKTCRFHSNKVECRATKHECDVPEFCTGEGHECPLNITKSGLERCLGKTHCENYYCKANKTKCPENCNGNGVCDSEGRCHCFGKFDNSSTCSNIPTTTIPTTTTTSESTTTTIITSTSTSPSTIKTNESTITIITSTTTNPSTIETNESTDTESPTPTIKLGTVSISHWLITIILALLLLIFVACCLYFIFIPKCYSRRNNNRSDWNPKILFVDRSSKGRIPPASKGSCSSSFLASSPQNLQYSDFPYPEYELPPRKNQDLNLTRSGSSRIPEQNENETGYSTLKKDRHRLDAFSMDDFSKYVILDEDNSNSRIQSRQKKYKTLDTAHVSKLF